MANLGTREKGGMSNDHKSTTAMALYGENSDIE